MSMGTREGLEPLIDRWRTYVLAHGAAETDVAVVEGQLRDQATRLGDAGLDADEAFLVALRRVAASDEASRRLRSRVLGRAVGPAAEAVRANGVRFAAPRTSSG